MNGIQFVADDKGRRTAVLIDLEKHGKVLQAFWNGLIVESRRKEKDVPFAAVQKARAKRRPVSRRGAIRMKL